MKKKIIIILSSVIVLAIIICSLMLLIAKKQIKLTALEQSTLKNAGEVSMLYFDKIDSENNGIDQYIAFALEYSSNEDNKNELTINEIKDITSEFFNLSLNSEDLKENGISPLLLENNISYDYEKETYSIHKNKLSQQDIANTDIIIYVYENAKKQKDKYIVTYKKYIINNPCEVLNYYEQTEENEDGTISNKKYDTTEILAYLKAKGNVNAIKKAVTKDMVSEVSEYSKDITVTYVMINDELLIDSVK